MHDKRVVRGNTYSAHVQVRGGGCSPAALPRLKTLDAMTLPRRAWQKAATVPAEDARVEKQQSRAWIPPTHSTIYDVKPEARRFVPVPLEQHLEEQRPPVREADAETQTAAFRARPDTPPYVPHKTGVDASTQITPEDGLFVFDKEVVPIVEVVASKTLEQSLLEVEEEEELAALRRAKVRTPPRLHARRRHSPAARPPCLSPTAPLQAGGTARAGARAGHGAGGGAAAAG